MGSGVPRGARPPSHVAYFVALAGILGLLVLLCFYFFYYFIKKVKELSQQETPLQTPTCRTPAPTVATYPVQPVVRDSATAMAKLCKQLPAPSTKGDTVFPTSTSPAALHTDTGDGVPVPPGPPGPPTVPVPMPEKVPAPAAAVTALETVVAR